MGASNSTKGSPARRATSAQSVRHRSSLRRDSSAHTGTTRRFPIRQQASNNDFLFIIRRTSRQSELTQGSHKMGGIQSQKGHWRRALSAPTSRAFRQSASYRRTDCWGMGANFLRISMLFRRLTSLTNASQAWASIDSPPTWSHFS